MCLQEESLFLCVQEPNTLLMAGPRRADVAAVFCVVGGGHDIGQAQLQIRGSCREMSAPVLYELWCVKEKPHLGMDVLFARVEAVGSCYMGGVIRFVIGVLHTAHLVDGVLLMQSRMLLVLHLIGTLSCWRFGLNPSCQLKAT